MFDNVIKYSDVLYICMNVIVNEYEVKVFVYDDGIGIDEVVFVEWNEFLKGKVFFFSYGNGYGLYIC